VLSYAQQAPGAFQGPTRRGVQLAPGSWGLNQIMNAGRIEVRMKKTTLAVSMLLIFSVLFLAGCGISAQLADRVSGLGSQVRQNNVLPAVQAQATPAVQAEPGLLAAYEDTLAGIYAQVNPSVVNIQVLQQGSRQSSNSGQESPFGNTPDSQLPEDFYSQGAGSGFIWDDQGHIVTNNHVVEGADRINVIFSDGTTVPAEVVGADLFSDLAVLKADIPSGLKPLTLADSTQVRVGQLAIAIGNPFGLDGTMTVGIVSAVGRSLPAGSMTGNGATYSIPDIIQTDAPINPGNSGGVLVNADGQVIGVTAAIESSTGSNAGIGFAIPSAMVNQVVPDLIEKGRHEHSWLGVLATTLTPELASAMDLPEGQRGVLVIEVTQDSPADQAGLQASQKPVTINGQQVQVGGDVITAIEGNAIRSMDELITYLTGQTSVGQTVSVTILRNGQERTVEVTLTARPNG
jgi:S1-C subfamily serine protease